MKKNGFTLIELLGVIIILALLMILVLPSIVNSVKSSSDKTDDLTLELIYNASNLYISNHSDSFRTTNGNKYSISLRDLIEEGHLVSPITLSDGIDITDNKCVQVTYNNGFSYELKDIGNCEELIQGCTVVSGDGTNVGDEIACGTESFYVISNDGSNITMLAKYNLTLSTTNPLQDPAMMGETISDSGGTSSCDPGTGCIYFSDNNNYYWEPNSTYDGYYVFDEYTGSYSPAGDSALPYVYDANSLIFPYVEAYETYLKTNGISNASATLMSYEQAIDLGCGEPVYNDSWHYASSDVCTSAPNWVYSRSYWLGSASTSYTIVSINSAGQIYYYHNYYENGIRPVVTISTSDLIS